MRKPSLLIIFLTVFIDLVGFGIVLPMLPVYAEEFGAGGLKIGIIIGSYSLMQFFFAPFWGRLSDRIGRRPVILISLFGSTAAYGLFGYSAYFTGTTGLWILLISRLFAGFCGANLSVASAYIADITSAENRSKGMGLIGMAFGFGFILGPFIGAQSYYWFGLSGPGYVAAAICGTNLLLGCFLLSESRKAESRSAAQRPRWDQWKHVFSHPRLRLLIGLFFLANFTFVSFEVTLPLLLGSPTIKSDELVNSNAVESTLSDPENEPQQILQGLMQEYPDGNLLDRLNQLLLNEKLHELVPVKPELPEDESKILSRELDENQISPRYNRILLEQLFPDSIQSQQFYFNKSQIGYLFGYCGLIAAFVQGGLIGRLVKRFGEPKLVWSSMVIVALSMILIPYSLGVGILLLALGLFSGGSGINRAPTMGMISKCADQHEQGATLGVAQSVGTLARILGPVFATTAYAVRPVLPYLICAIIALVAAIIAWSQLRKV